MFFSPSNRIQQNGLADMLTLARTTIAIALLLALMLIGTIIGARAQTSAAQKQAVQTQRLWPIRDLGRNHGYVTGPGMPKCNPSVSEECRRLFYSGKKAR
jgi:hypothetical protein